MLNAINPGQTSYKVLSGGTPESAFSLQINIPWPYVTDGTNPIQVHDGTGPGGVTLGDGRCFAPDPALAGFTITTDGGKLSSSGYPVILRGDYPMRQLGSTTAVCLNGTLDGFGDGVVYIEGGTPADVNGQDYTVSFSYGQTLSSTVCSVNSRVSHAGFRDAQGQWPRASRLRGGARLID